MKLDSGRRHLLHLAMREADADGWAEVSSVLWPLLSSLPDDLVEKRSDEDGTGHIRLTASAKAILAYT